MGLPCVSGRDVVRARGKVGFAQVSQRGSHIKLRHADGRVVIVPDHAELKQGTLRSILRQAHLTPGEFEELL